MWFLHCVWPAGVSQPVTFSLKGPVHVAVPSFTRLLGTERETLKHSCLLCHLLWSGQVWFCSMVSLRGSEPSASPCTLGLQASITAPAQSFIWTVLHQHPIKRDMTSTLKQVPAHWEDEARPNCFERRQLLVLRTLKAAEKRRAVADGKMSLWLLHSKWLTQQTPSRHFSLL